MLDVFAKAFAGGGPRKNVREENNQRDRVSAVRTAFGAERFDSLVAAAKQRPGTARYPHVAERLRAVADGGHSTSIRLWQVAPGASEMEKAALYQTLNQAGRDLAAVHSGAAAVAVTTGIEMYSALTVGNNCAVDAMATLRSTLDARRCAMEGSGQVFDGFMDPTVEAVGRAGAEPSPDGVSDALSVALEDMRQQLVKEAVCCLDVSPAVVQRLTGLAHMDVSDLVSALQAPLPPPHPGEDASAAVKEAYQAQAKCRELHQSLFGVMAASRHVPIALYSGTQDGDGVVTVQAQLFTGGQQLVGRRWGAQVQAPGAGAGSSSSSAAAQEAEGMSQGVDALDMLCVANWAGHYYAAVPASAINILLPSAEDLASVGASGGCTADSGLKQLGRPFNMAMLPSHQRQLLEEVSASAYVNEGRVVPLAARSVTPAAVRAGFLDDVDLRLSCEDLAAICGSGEEGWIPSILGHNCRSPAREEGTMRSRGTKIAASGGGFSALADCDPGDVPPERQVYEKQRSGKGTAQRGAPQPQRGQGASSGVEKSRKRTGSLRGAGAASTGSPVVSAGKRQRHCERQHEGDTATANNVRTAVVAEPAPSPIMGETHRGHESGGNGMAPGAATGLMHGEAGVAGGGAYDYGGYAPAGCDEQHSVGSDASNARDDVMNDVVEEAARRGKQGKLVSGGRKGALNTQGVGQGTRRAGGGVVIPEAVKQQADAVVRLVVQSPIGAATTGGRENELLAWKKFQEIAKDEDVWRGVPADARKMWPMPVESWCRVLVYMRSLHKTYGAFRNAVNAVCKVGAKTAHNWHVAECVQRLGNASEARGVMAFDPRKLYSEQHRATMDLIRRDGGVQVTHTEYINMEEARNGHKFTDHASLPGLQESACWNMENLSGGRRPRSLTALRVRHLKWTVTRVKHHVDEEWVAPSLTYEFVDEKFMDKRGPRSVSEEFSHFSNFERDGPLSSAVYLYALFKARGIFKNHDPLSELRPGSTIETHEWAQDYFVFCHMEGDTFFDCVPLCPGAISDVTRHILKRMGRNVRGGRAHRHGAYTRPQMMNLLQNKGVGLDPKTEGVVYRAAGWSSVHGPTTTRTTYESILLDRAMNPFGLFYGVNMEDEVWGKRLAEWMGRDVSPAAPIRHQSCRGHLPFLVRLRALHMDQVVQARRRMNVIGVQLLHDGLYGGQKVVLAQRECSIYEAWRRTLKQGARGGLGDDMSARVAAYEQAVKQYRVAAREATDTERHVLAAEFMTACDAACVGLPIRGNGARMPSQVRGDNAVLVQLARRHVCEVALLPECVNMAMSGREGISKDLHITGYPYRFWVVVNDDGKCDVT